MWSIISLGLNKGYEAYESNMWFLFVEGNWNCKCLIARLPLKKVTHKAQTQVLQMQASSTVHLQFIMKTRQE